MSSCANCTITRPGKPSRSMNCKSSSTGKKWFRQSAAMPRLFEKVFRRYGSKTIRLRAAILRHPTRSPAEIAAFLDELFPLVERGNLTTEEFQAKHKEL